jgi:hypothetical protein
MDSQGPCGRHLILRVGPLLLKLTWRVDMAAFWRERNGPKPKNWFEDLGGPTSHLQAHFTQLLLFSQLLVLSNISSKVVSNILSFNSSKGIIHLSPSGPWIGPYNMKSLGPIERPTLK